MSKTPNKNERLFIDFLETQGKTWEFEPKALETGVACRQLTRSQTYTPGFWCPEDNCYYEVSATRQAYFASLEKVSQIRKNNPEFNLVFVNPEGSRFVAIPEFQTPKPNNYNMTWTPEKILALRQELGLSQEEAARKADVSLLTWQRWEGGHNAPGYAAQRKLSKLK